MTALRDIPVRYKLAAVIAITTMTALFLISTAYIAFDHYTSMGMALDELQGVARMLAANSVSAATSDDPLSASLVLGSVEQDPEIQTACTYDADGSMLAQYHRSYEALCPPRMPETPLVAFASFGALCRQPIVSDGRAVGYIYLESDLSKMKDRRGRFITITAMFLLVSLATASLVGAGLNRWITAPIVELVAVMRHVSWSRDFSLRVMPRGQDEIGALVQGFNEMLYEIQGNQARLLSQALTDELTGLPNRRLLNDRLTQLLAIARRREQQLAVLYLDLDGFKLVNDTLGHSAGDQLLQQVAGRLQSRVRAADTLARIGGDEFTVVLGYIHNPEDAETVGAILLKQLAMPFAVNGNQLTLTASMGVSLYPDDSENPEQLIQHADTAMYVAKNTGKNCLKFYSPEFGDIVRERLELENQLRGAIERDELFIDYQPEFDLASGRLLRFEALARWRHPTLGVIPPGKFIPIAEDTGLIVQIGSWVMERACEEAVRWQQISSVPVQVAVNVSNVQFFREEFPTTVAAVLTRTGLDPALLQLELTESVFIPGVAASAEKMSRLQALGVSMAVDDFGTGYSTLSYLPRLPFDCLKIDRSFLSQIAHSQDSQALMNSLVKLAHELNRRVIAEGVETTEQLNMTQQSGCDEVQGFLLGRPTANPEEFLSGRHDPWAELADTASPGNSTAS